MNIGLAALNRAFAFGTPILWVALGEICSERAGVVNLPLDGMMTISALGAFSAAQSTHSTAIGLAAGIVVGGVSALPQAVASITLRANQFVAGLALAMFWPGVASLAGRRWVGTTIGNPMQPLSFPSLARIPGIGPALFTDQSMLTYAVLVAAPIIWLFLFRTRWGVIWRSVGEAPEAADACGINVTALRYAAVLLGGLLAGVGGSYLSLAYNPAWVEGVTGGMGWIALSIVIFSGWDPMVALAGALLFGVLYYLSFRLQSQLEPHILKVIPYLSVVIILTISAVRRRSGSSPRALGLPFFRGDR